MLLEQGAGLDKLREIITAQGGNPDVINNPELLPQAAEQVEVQAEGQGYIQGINAREIGWASLLLGAGRLRKEDEIDPAVGITLRKKMGDAVSRGATLAVLHVNRSDNLAEVKERVKNAFVIGPEVPTLPPLIYDVIY